MDWRAEIREEFARLGKPGDDDIVEEMAQHADAAWAAERAEGASPENASAAVRDLIRAWCSGTAGVTRVRRAPLLESAPAEGAWFAGFGLDTRHALRLLRRQPGFAFASILMLALGIGAATTVFTVVNGVVLKPLPWPNASRIVRVSETRQGGTVNTQPVFSNATYLAWQEHASTIDAIAGYSETTVTLDGAGGTERIPAARVTASLFPLLGVAPAVGPGFSASEEERPLAVISYGFWRERFGGASDVIGRTLLLSSGVVTIVGVMPAAFMFPTPDARLWLPSHIPGAIVPNGGRTVSLFDAIALLKPGATPAQAADEAERAARALPDLGPVIPAVFGSTGLAVVAAKPLSDAIVGDVRPALWMLMVAVLLLWLAAIGNVASMQLAQGVARRKEVAIRAAIGAGTRRLVRQLLVENLVLGVAGGAAGLLLTAGALGVLLALLPADFPRAEMVRIDGRVFLAAAVLSCVAALATALLPARLAAALDLRAAVAGEAVADGRRRLIGPRQVIMVGQVAIAAVLLIAGALLTRSFVNLWIIDRGFDRSHVLTAIVQLPASRPATDRAAVFDRMLDQLRRDARVVSLGMSDDIPLGGRERRFASTVQEPGQTPRTISAVLREVTPGYFTAIGMRLSEGRDLTMADRLQSEPVAVVNRTFARKYMGAAPVGEVLPVAIDRDRDNGDRWRVVGIVDDAQRASVSDPAQPEIFVPVAQISGGPGRSQYIVLRTNGDPYALVGAVRAAVRAAEDRASLDQMLSMDARLMRSLSRPRLFAVMFGGFAALAALVAMVGLFGGLSYAVAQRTREIGVRSALGATRLDIVRLVVTQGLTLSMAGLVVGMTTAAFSAQLLGQFLFGVTTRDPFTYAAVAVGLAIVAVVACAIPARRAAGIDPTQAMRN